MSVGPRPMVYIDLSMIDTRNGRIPTGLEKKKSMDVQMATAIQRRTENSGESVPGKGGAVTCHQEQRENTEILLLCFIYTQSCGTANLRKMFYHKERF